MNLNVNEIFYSIQGEGNRTGEASIFIRLAKCNLSCSYCDTDFESGVAMNCEELLNKIEKFKSNRIIWTGGEPTLQLNDAVVTFFKKKGYLQSIETNGTGRVPKGIDYIACSPKQNWERIKELIPEVDELRFAIKKGDPLPDITILPKAKHYLLSPIFAKNRMVSENVYWCISLIKDNPVWKLSIQIHKLIGIS